MSSNTEEDSDKLTGEIIRSLYERHDAFKGSIEPVYGKKVYIGDTCQFCNTHFRGLEDDIKLLVKHHVKEYDSTLKAEYEEKVREADRDGYMRALAHFSNYFMDASIAAQRNPILPDIAREFGKSYQYPVRMPEGVEFSFTQSPSKEEPEDE